MKNKKDIRELLLLIQPQSSGMGAFCNKGFINKFFVILKENNIEMGVCSEMTDCSTPGCYEPEEEE